MYRPPSYEIQYSITIKKALPTGIILGCLRFFDFKEEQYLCLSFSAYAYEIEFIRFTFKPTDITDLLVQNVVLSLLSTVRTTSICTHGVGSRFKWNFVSYTIRQRKEAFYKNKPIMGILLKTKKKSHSCNVNLREETECKISSVSVF